MDAEMSTRLREKIIWIEALLLEHCARYDAKSIVQLSIGKQTFDQPNRKRQFVHDKLSKLPYPSINASTNALADTVQANI